MNRRPPGSKTPARRGKALSSGTAVEGFLQSKTAEGLSPRTIESYRHDLQLWLEYQGEGELSRITTPLVTRYLNYLRTEYQPRRITGGNDRACRPRRCATTGSACRPSFTGRPMSSPYVTP